MVVDCVDGDGRLGKILKDDGINNWYDVED